MSKIVTYKIYSNTNNKLVKTLNLKKEGFETIPFKQKNETKVIEALQKNQYTTILLGELARFLTKDTFIEVLPSAYEYFIHEGKSYKVTTKNQKSTILCY